MAFEALKQRLGSSEIQAELDKPLVQWSLFGSIIIVLWAIFLQPVLDWRETSLAEIAQSQLQRTKEQSLLVSQQELQTSLREYQNWIGKGKAAYLQGRSEGAATSNLVVILEKKFTPLDISFSTRRFMPAEVAPWVGEKIETRWVFRGKANNLIDFIHQVAGHSPEVLVIDKAELRQVTKDQFELAVNIYAFKAMSDRNLISESRRLEASQ